MSIFKELVNYINSQPIGYEFTRQELITYIDDGIDIYRTGLEDLGYIKTIGRGRYTKISNIPSYINSANYRLGKDKIAKIELLSNFKLL
jgi:hypothetical protein